MTSEREIAALDEQVDKRLEKIEQKLELLNEESTEFKQIADKILDFVIHCRRRCRCGAWESTSHENENENGNAAHPTSSEAQATSAAQPTSAAPEKLAAEMEVETTVSPPSPSQPQQVYDHAPPPPPSQPQQEQQARDQESLFVYNRRRKTDSKIRKILDSSLAPPNKKKRQNDTSSFKEYKCIPTRYASTKDHYIKFTNELKAMGGVEDATRECLMGNYDKTFFNEVLHVRGSFSFEMIQECMNGLLLKQKKFPEYFDQSVAIIDAYFTDIVTRVYKEDEIHVNRTVQLLMKYCTGTHKYWPSIPWKDARAICFPIYLPLHSHWVACMADMDSSTLVIYDSNIDCFKDSELDSMLKPYAVLLPLTLHKAGYIQSCQPWLWTRPQDTPQNNLGGDSGPFTVKYLELAMNTAEFSSSKVSDDTIQSYRTYLALSIWMRDWLM